MFNYLVLRETGHVFKDIVLEGKMTISTCQFEVVTIWFNQISLLCFNAILSL